jgi:hypothetical protein
MDDMTKKTDADIGHNEPLDLDAERGLEAARDYQIGIAKERAGFEQAKIGRDQAIGAAVRYGQALIDGRARRKLNNNAFSDWVKASGLDRVSPFDQRQERAAAQQIAEIALKHVASRVDGTTTVNPFDECPHSRPTNIMRWWRANQPKPAPQPRAPAPVAPPPKPAAPRVQQAADRAEVETLRKEVWRLRDKLDQLAIFLVEKPAPKAENRPVAKHRYWPLPLDRRPNDVPPRQIVDPDADLTTDPAFALRREEFEQWLVRRKETLEHQFTAREKELNDTFEPRIKARVKKAVEAQMAKERMYSSPFTEAQLKTLLIVTHPDTREKATTAQKDSAARIILHSRSRLVFKDREKGSTYIPPESPSATPEKDPPQARCPDPQLLYAERPRANSHFFQRAIRLKLRGIGPPGALWPSGRGPIGGRPRGSKLGHRGRGSARAAWPHP